jgi:Tol biopolymer transport system component
VEHAESEIHLYEIGTGRMSLLLSRFRDYSGTEWTPDSEIAWSSLGMKLAVSARAPGSSPNIVVALIEGKEPPVHIFPSPNFQYPGCWAPDGKRLIYTEQDLETGWDILELTMGAGEVTSRGIIKKRGTQAQPSLSPNGRWLAYSSFESGQAEVYVMPYDHSGRAYKVSVDGGISPAWDPTGRTVYYRRGKQMLAVDITTEPVLSAGKPRVLFEGRYEPEYVAVPRRYDITPDGQRFLMIQPVGETQSRRIHVVQNWHEELQRLVPTEN